MSKEKELKINDDMSIVRVVDNLLNYAIISEAETILIEPGDKDVSVSFNINGDFSKVVDLPKKIEKGVIDKIKELADISEENSKLPQFGRFKKTFLGFKIIFSVSIRPVKIGEKVIIEIYNEKSKLLHLKQLGLSGRAFKIVKNNLEKEHGGVVVVGGFNSGKTTTLYSFLNFVNSPEVNVSTIENEINYDIPFINQSLLDIKRGFDHFFALSSLLRQDPNVIMIDEVNNRQTAETFLNIAERGHLTLASIHSKSIFTSLNFLKDLDISLLLFASTVKMIVAQRLFRKICPYCVTKQELNKDMIKNIKEKFDITDLIKRAKKEKIISESVKKLEDFSFYKSRGCSKCDKGFLESIGVFEVLEITEKVRELIREGHLSKIKNEIKNQGGFSLEEDAFLKASNGIININEVF